MKARGGHHLTPLTRPQHIKSGTPCHYALPSRSERHKSHHPYSCQESNRAASFQEVRGREKLAKEHHGGVTGQTQNVRGAAPGR